MELRLPQSREVPFPYYFFVFAFVRLSRLSAPASTGSLREIDLQEGHFLAAVGEQPYLPKMKNYRDDYCCFLFSSNSLSNRLTGYRTRPRGKRQTLSLQMTLLVVGESASEIFSK